MRNVRNWKHKCEMRRKAKWKMWDIGNRMWEIKNKESEKYDT